MLVHQSKEGLFTLIGPFLQLLQRRDFVEEEEEAGAWATHGLSFFLAIRCVHDLTHPRPCQMGKKVYLYSSWGSQPAFSLGRGMPTRAGLGGMSLMAKSTTADYINSLALAVR